MRTRLEIGPEQLAKGFGPDSPLARSGVPALYTAVRTAGHPEVQAALQRWRVLFADTRGGQPTHPTAGIEKLAARYGLAADEPDSAELLFSLHTYYALAVKLLAWRVIFVAHGRAGDPVLGNPVLGLGEAGSVPTDERLRERIEQLESGDLFRELNIVDPFQGNLFAWYLQAWNEGVAELVHGVAELLGRYDIDSLVRDPAAGGDLLKALYQALFPGSLRHVLGEYYTPDWLAEHLLDKLGYAADSRSRLLDPACGSGTFLVAAIRRIRKAASPDGESLEGKSPDGKSQNDDRLSGRILSGVVGFDLNPLAVMAARTNYLIAIADLLPCVESIENEPVEIPVYWYDSILGTAAGPDQSPPSGPGMASDRGRSPALRQSPPDPGIDQAEINESTFGSFDYVVGNPPWIAWDNLPADYRQASKPLWERYGLFSLSASQARHGGGKKDLSMLMMYVAADRHLKDAGRLGFVITQTLFQTKGAGDGFRRFRLGEKGAWLKVIGVDDMVEIRPFPGTANWTATIVVEKGRPTSYPIPYTKWSPAEPSSDEPSSDEPSPDESSPTGSPPQQYKRQPCRAGPIDPRRDSSPWIVLPEAITTDVARLIGPSDYCAHIGANSGGANGVYWVTLESLTDDGVLVRNLSAKGKRAVPSVRREIEAGLLYPLVRWSDVARYRAEPAAHILLVQDVHTRRGIDREIMLRDYPKTLAYLEQFRQLLCDRAAYRRYQERAEFYSMYNVGEYTVAPWKVVWRRMDRRINAAVVGRVDDPLLGSRAVIPQETCVLVAVDSSVEAHYLCAVLNSSVASFLVTSHSVRGGKGFGTPSMLDFLNVRRHDPADPRHAELAECSRQAHLQSASGQDIGEIQSRIDRLAARLWNLSPGELDSLG